MKKLYSCKFIDSFDLVINGMINEECISFCCYDYKDKPLLKLTSDIDENVTNIINLRNDIILNGLNNEGCKSCELYSKDINKRNNKIKFINLSIYPSPCQCNCIYCDIRKSREMMLVTPEMNSYYGLLFKTIDKLYEMGIMDDNPLYQVSCGEISIHSYKDKILSYVKDKRVMFYSNCMIYDKDISNILMNNKAAYINCSIDAGNKELWKYIKGNDLFETVLDNIKKYISISDSSRICLKYIILTNINDDIKSFNDLIETMKYLEINHIIISINYDSSDLIKDKKSCEDLKRLLEDNNMTYEIGD